MINTGLCGLLSSNPFLSDIRARKMLVHDVIYRRQKYYEYYRLDQEKEKEQRWRTSAFPKCWETFDWKAVVENCSLLGITEKLKILPFRKKNALWKLLWLFSQTTLFLTQPSYYVSLTKGECQSCEIVELIQVWVSDWSGDTKLSHQIRPYTFSQRLSNTTALPWRCLFCYCKWCIRGNSGLMNI